MKRTSRTISLAIAAVSIASASIAYASPVGGPQHDIDALRPGASVTYTMALRAGEYTTIAVDGDSDGDLDCYLYDGGGNLVDDDERTVDACVLRVAPEWTGRFRLVVTNNGNISDRYELVAF
jgi:hypothetical protein